MGRVTEERGKDDAGMIATAASATTAATSSASAFFVAWLAACWG